MTTLLCLALMPLASEAAATPNGEAASPPVVKVDFVFDNAVRKTRDLPTSALRAARRQMIAGEPMSGSKLQMLADAGDGLAAFRYAKQLQEEGKPDPSGATAHYFAIAAYTGRAFAVAPLARLLKADGSTYSASRLRHCLNAMTVQALSGNAEAATLLGEMYADGTPFGRDLAQAQHFLGMGTGDVSRKAALSLGLALLSDPEDAAAGHVGALSALRVAAEGEDLSVRVTAENLLRQIEAAPAPGAAPENPPMIQPEVTQ
ncbi:hypothetical protein [Frigidibacter sp.]|uniref:hypothetical protein n=1 Tax=Frigidibacter sp. TaxID=2586418 RepID=UPI002735FA1B|nr:hypothetical protein [Frigidibacter sp.]MDP3342287.1 hypothetical protein [Frigidibacter sp.]